MARFLWICLGGAIGTGGRYLLSGWAATAFGAGFPWGTLIVNVAGSFLLGALMRVGLATAFLPPIARIALSTGVLGGFTTYSTFNYETLEYLRSGATLLAVTNVALTVGGCLFAGAAGLAAAQWWLAR